MTPQQKLEAAKKKVKAAEADFNKAKQKLSKAKNAIEGPKHKVNAQRKQLEYIKKDIVKNNKFIKECNTKINSLKKKKLVFGIPDPTVLRQIPVLVSKVGAYETANVANYAAYKACNLGLDAAIGTLNTAQKSVKFTSGVVEKFKISLNVASKNLGAAKKAAKKT